MIDKPGIYEISECPHHSLSVVEEHHDNYTTEFTKVCDDCGVTVERIFEQGGDERWE